MHLDRLSRRVARAGCATALVLAVSLPAAAEGPATTPLSTCASCDTAALTDADIQTSRQVWHAPGSLPDWQRTANEAMQNKEVIGAAPYVGAQAMIFAARES